MRRSSCVAVLFSIGFLSWNSSLPGQNLEIKAYLNRTQIVLNQQFELSIELTGADVNGAPEPAVPDLGAFATYVYGGQSTNMSWVNGRMSITKVYTHHFIATKVGQFQIPAITVQYKGKDISTKPIVIEIVKGGARSQANRQPGRNSNRPARTPARDLSEQLFLKAEVNKRQVYQNEPLVVSYKIYTAVRVGNYGVVQLPNTVGFWAEEFDIPNRPPLHTEVVNGIQFQVAEIKKVALFPQGPGEKQLDPLMIECEVQLPRTRGRRDFLDSFFDDPFFGRARTVRQRVVSNTVAIDVLPLPVGHRPADFSGAVGDFAITASVDKVRAKTNEAVTLTVKISGTGNIKIIPQPEISFPPDFEVYDPKVTESIQRSSGGISGSKTFEYVLIPRLAGNQSINPISFSYFDPSSKRYKAVTTRRIDLVIEKGRDQFVSRGIATSKEDVKFIGRDIRYIQMRLPEFRRGGTLFYKSYAFYLCLGVPLFALFAAVAYRRHLDELSSNIAYARSRKANQMALRRLKRANQEMRSGNYKQFYAEVSSALMGFIGDKLNVSAAGLITDQVDEMLRVRGIDSEIVSAYLDCLHTCDYQRFAPSQTHNGEMKDFFEKAKNAIISLDKVI